MREGGVKKEQQIFFSSLRTGRENGRDERATGDKGIKRGGEEERREGIVLSLPTKKGRKQTSSDYTAAHRLVYTRRTDLTFYVPHLLVHLFAWEPHGSPQLFPHLGERTEFAGAISGDAKEDF